MSSATSTAPHPQKILQFAFGFVPSVAVATAVDLDLFSQIHKGHHTPAQLAEVCQISERGVRPLLHTLSALALVEEKEGEFRLTPDTEMFLVKSSPAYLGGMLTHQLHHMAQWAHFGEAVKKGTSPLSPVEGDEDKGEFFASFVGSLYSMNWPAAQAVAAHLPSCHTALDIGCGSGVWSLALAKKESGLQVTAVDRARVLDVTGEFAARFQCADRYTMRAGNFREVELEPNHYDVAFLGHILHSEGEEASEILVRRLHDSLKPGGILVTAEMVASQPRGEELFPNLFELNMLMWTEQGCVFNREQLERMGTQAGFVRHEWISTPSPSPVLLSYKA